MMTDGWIKLYRKITEWEWYTVPSMAHLFIHLLLVASRQDKRWRGMVIKQGQVVTSTRRLAEQTGLSRNTVKKSLKTLEASKDITMGRAGSGTLVTILNYANYQELSLFDPPADPPADPHNKNIRNKERKPPPPPPPRAREVLKKTFMTA